MLQNSKREEHWIENVNSQVEFKWRSQESEPWQRVVLESIDLMQQHTSNVLIQEKEQIRNKSEKEEVVPRYKFTPPPYYQND